MELSGEFPVKLLCETTGILRSSFYSWKKQLSNPSDRTKNFVSNILLFQEYHLKYPSHGYRWLNAKIRMDTGLVLSDPYAHKCCKTAGIKSKAKHYKYKKPGDPSRVFPNLLLSEMQIDGPMQCIVSDMTAFWVKGVYYELALYMNDLYARDTSNKIKMSAAYEAEQKELEQSIAACEQEMKEADKAKVDLRMLLKGLREFTELRELTPTIVNTVIQRIEVHNSDRSSGHIRVKVDIYFTAAGMIDIPAEEDVKAIEEEISANPQKYRFSA